MARQPRLELPGIAQHVIQRGNNRGLCFKTDADRRLYLRCLAQAANRYGCSIHAYVLMSNHVHLLVTPLTTGAVSATMQDTGRRYVRLFNETHGRTGTLWEGRYKASLIDSDSYLLICHCYIELNPVRAGLVQHPLRYRWSSHAHYVLGVEDPLVTRHALFTCLAESEDARRRAFTALIRTTVASDTIERIRESANKGWPLGSDAFLDRVERALGRNVRPPKRGRPAEAISAEGPEQGEMLI